MLVNTPTNYNINHYGYLKDQRILQHNLKKAQFKLYNLNSTENQIALREAERAIDKFQCDNNFKTILYNLPKIIKFCFTRFSMQKQKKLRHDTNNAFEKFNKLEFEYEGEKSSYTGFRKRILNEKDIQKKEEMNKILKEKLNTMQPIIKSIVRTRNIYAQERGYENYYQYQLKKEYGTTEAEIDKIIDNYYKEKDVFSALRKREAIIAEKNNLKPEELTNSHKQTPLYFASGINNYIESPQQVIDIAKKSFTSMGYDIEQLEKDDRILFDLEVNDKKINSTYCRSFIPGESVGICASIYNDVISLCHLLHETGHGVHFLNSFKWLPNCLKKHNWHISEAVAIMFESLVHKENLLKGIVPDSVLKDFQEEKTLQDIAVFALLATSAQFEKELYKNPEQDLEELFNKIEKKYCGNNLGFSWFAPHFITTPAYIQNYVRALILSDKIYNSTKTNLGTELSSNPKTAEFMKNRIFGLGKLVNDKTLDLLLKL